MCPRELVEKDGACKRAKDKQRRSSGPRSFLRGKEREITVDGSSLTVVPLNMRCRRPRVLRLFSSSSLFLFSFFLSCPVLSLSLSVSHFAVSLASPLHSKPQNSRAYLVYSFNTSLSNRLLQLQYRATVLSRSPRTPRSVGLDGNRSSMTRFAIIFEYVSRKGNPFWRLKIRFNDTTWG